MPIIAWSFGSVFHDRGSRTLFIPVRGFSVVRFWLRSSDFVRVHWFLCGYFNLFLFFQLLQSHWHFGWPDRQRLMLHFSHLCAVLKHNELLLQPRVGSIMYHHNMNTKKVLSIRRQHFCDEKLTSDIWIRTMKGQFHLAFCPETILGDFFDVPDNVGSNGIGFLHISPKGRCGTAREGSDNFWDLCLWYFCLLLGLLNPFPIFHVILTLLTEANGSTIWQPQWCWWQYNVGDRVRCWLPNY